MSTIKSLPEYRSLSSPLSSIRMEHVGDWGRMGRILNYLRDPGNAGVKRDIARAQRTFLERVRTNLVMAIASGGQTLPRRWAAHSKGYRSPTGIVGVRTANYLTALESMPIVSSGYVVTMKLPQAALNRKSVKGGFTMAKYARIFEEGAVHQPARPLWGQIFDQTGGTNALIRGIHGAINNRMSQL